MTPEGVYAPKPVWDLPFLPPPSSKTSNWASTRVSVWAVQVSRVLSPPPLRHYYFWTAVRNGSGWKFNWRIGVTCTISWEWLFLNNHVSTSLYVNIYMAQWGTEIAPESLYDPVCLLIFTIYVNTGNILQIGNISVKEQSRHQILHFNSPQIHIKL